MQGIPPEWLQQLDELLALTETEQGDGDEERLIAQLAGADPELLTYLIGQFADQDSPQAAALLELLAANPNTPGEARAEARTALDTLNERGITVPAPGEERFAAGWAQEGRERGEQILMLGWRMPTGNMEALVFLLDWRGDGLKDFYRTRRMTDAEWRELVTHNGSKGASLTEVTLPEARVLVERALAESRRFSRPMPREYKVESGLIQRRILDAAQPPEHPRSFIAADLAPDAVVRAYIAALHYRDYALAALLLAPDHPLREGHTAEEAADELRAQLKHAPRRSEEARTGGLDAVPETPGAEVTVEANGEETLIERHTNRRVRHPLVERYTLRLTDDGWRIVDVLGEDATTESRA